jgi:malonyl-CoA O-methyltransferase
VVERFRLKREPLVSLLVADQHHLPLPDNSVDLIWSSLCLHWSHDPVAVIEQWQRIIRPGGLLMFSTFGVDTLAELRGSGPDLMTFNDMHDIGDALVTAGFADPVMDMQQLTVNFSDPDRLLSDLSAIGGNALADRPSHLRSGRQKSRWLESLLRLRDSKTGQIPVTFELCFGHAWCPSPKRLPRGLEPLTFQPRPSAS